MVAPPFCAARVAGYKGWQGQWRVEAAVEEGVAKRCQQQNRTEAQVGR